MTDTPPFLSLPPLDRSRATRTGWGRAHWEALADHLLDARGAHAEEIEAGPRQPAFLRAPHETGGRDPV